MSSREVVQCVWESTNAKEKNIHEQCAKGVENILREAIFKKTIDNITVVVIGFSNFKKKIFPRTSKEKKNEDILKTATKATNNSIDTTNFNTSTNHNSHDYSSFFQNQNEPKKSSNFSKQIPDEHPEKSEKTLNSILERNGKNNFNPFLGSIPLTKKTELLNNVKPTITQNPILNYRSSKVEPFKKKDSNLKKYEDNGWEIKKDILSGKISMND